MAGFVDDAEPTELQLPGYLAEIDPLKPLTDAAKAGFEALISWLRMENCEIVRLDAGAAPAPQSQHVRFRVRYVIVSAITAGTMTLTVGTASYPFEGQARGNDAIPFPLVIERGSDMSCVGTDGRIFLVGDVE